MRAAARAQAAAAVLEAFPPRGIARLLPPEHTSHGKPQIERLVAEEYILDTILFFEGDRVQCAQHLASESFISPASFKAGRGYPSFQAPRWHDAQIIGHQIATCSRPCSYHKVVWGEESVDMLRVGLQGCRCLISMRLF